MKNLINIILFFSAVFIFSCTQKHIQQKSDWYMAGNKPNSYTIVFTSEEYKGEQIFYLKSIVNVTDGFGTIMCDIKPGDYKGKRIRLSCFVKTENISNWAGLWMRIDGFEQGKMLGFDNMWNRPIKGTTDWQKYEIVLDVPDSAEGIFYGVLVNGNGQAWLIEPELEIVGSDVPSTNILGTEFYKASVENYSDLPPELKSIPDGITVKHDPQTVYATKTKDDTTMYYWFYKTTVESVKEDLEITEFGAYILAFGYWEFSTVTGKPFDKKDFSDWYECTNGKMKKGKEYTDKNNWTRWPTLQKGKTLWYYIGINDKGVKFKGTAMVDYLAEIK